MPPSPNHSLDSLIPLKAGRPRMGDDNDMNQTPAMAAAAVPRTEHAASAAPVSIFVPKEHGSWSLALEPLALGLIAAPSLAGIAFAGAVAAGFFARRPLKIATARGPADRRRAAREIFVAFSALAVGFLFEAAILGGWRALWPGLAIAPLAGLFLAFDTRNESRMAAAEIVGSAALALAPAALGALAGWPAGPALALSAVMLARSVPTVLAVRFCLRLAKGQSSGRAAALLPLLSATAACLAVGALASLRLVPVAAPLLSAVLVLRTGFYAFQRRPAWPARRVGICEAVLGAGYVAVIGFTWVQP